MVCARTVFACHTHTHHNAASPRAAIVTSTWTSARVIPVGMMVSVKTISGSMSASALLDTPTIPFKVAMTGARRNAKILETCTTFQAIVSKICKSVTPQVKIPNVHMLGATTKVVHASDRDALQPPWRHSAFLLVPVVSAFQKIKFYKRRQGA